MTNLSTEIFISLGVVNFPSMVTFYEGVLGFTPSRLKSGVYAEFHQLGTRLVLYSVPPENLINPIKRSYTSPGLSICLQVTELETLLQQISRAIAHSPVLSTVTIGTIMNQSHGREVHLSDPEGNRLILYQPIQKTATPSA